MTDSPSERLNVLAEERAALSAVVKDAQKRLREIAIEECRLRERQHVDDFFAEPTRIFNAEQTKRLLSDSDQRLKIRIDDPLAERSCGLGGTYIRQIAREEALKALLEAFDGRTTST